MKPLQLAIFLLLAAPAFAAPPATETRLIGKVVGVTDGDTITLRTETETLKVRLEAIDTPERGQPFGTKAKEALSNMVFGQSVTVESSGKDRYGRTLGTLFTNEKSNVNATLIRLGMAWHYRQYSKSTSLQELEDEARENRHGLWADPNPIPPWEWRRGKR